MLTSSTALQNFEKLKRVHHWNWQPLPNILTQSTMMKTNPALTNNPTTEENLGSVTISEEFCPKFNVYLNNGETHLHAKLQHPSPLQPGSTEK